MRQNRTRRFAFNLVAVIVVVVIIGVLAAIAIPRMSKGADISPSSSVRANLGILRSAIGRYAAEHNGRFPGRNRSTGTYGGAPEDFVAQLRQYSDVDGATGDYDVASGRIYGPYLGRAIPTMDAGEQTSSAEITFEDQDPLSVNRSRQGGWLYNPITGEIIANTDAEDEAGVSYSQY